MKGTMWVYFYQLNVTTRRSPFDPQSAVQVRPFQAATRGRRGCNELQRPNAHISRVCNSTRIRHRDVGVERILRMGQPSNQPANVVNACSWVPASGEEARTALSTSSISLSRDVQAVSSIG